MNQEEFRRLIAAGESPSEQAIGSAGWSDLDPLDFERFRRTIREQHGRGDEALLQLTEGSQV